MPVNAPPTNVTLPPITLGAGLRTSFTHTDASNGSSSANDFALDSVRLYLNGSVLPEIKFTFDTEYTGSGPAGSNTRELRRGKGISTDLGSKVFVNVPTCLIVAFARLGCVRCIPKLIQAA